MRIFVRWLGTIFLLSLIGSAAIGAEEGEKTAAIIEIEESTYDFGQVSQGEVVTHEFKVVNKGDAPLEIKSVKPG